MSAYVVADDHIDALLTFAIANGVDYYTGNGRVVITAHNATEVGAILLDENERSVRGRYDKASADEMIGEANAGGYKFQKFRQLSEMKPGALALLVLKGCKCLDYQCDETDDYKDSLAKKIILAIMADAISMLDGYDAAPWGITRERVKA
jgi:hypothetical protein